MGKKFVGLDGLKHFWAKAKTWIAGQITAEVTAKIAEYELYRSSTQGLRIVKYVDYTTIPLTFTQFQQLAIDLSNFGSEVTPDNVLCFMVTHWSGVQVIASGDFNNTTGLRCTLTAFQAGTGTATIRCVYMV